MKVVSGSIRTKVTLSLLAMSFVAIAVVGWTARTVVLMRFDDLVIERALRGFMSEARDYYQTYGSWEAAVAAEPFFDFVARTRPRLMQTPQQQDGRESFATASPDRDRRPPRRHFEFGGPPPPFLLVDASGQVVVPLAGRRVGETVEEELLESGRPVLMEGREIGLVVPLERPNLTELEQRYLSAIQDSWIYSLLLAAGLALPLGFWLAAHVTGPIRELTVAIRKMKEGELRQSVTVRSEDELGDLTASFNQMSRELSSACEQLEQSRAQLEEMTRRDELTGLLNRRAFNEIASDLWAQAERYEHPFTLAMADIDHFKEINDRYSHATGDAVLRIVADLIRSNIREVDRVARYGGEEFAIAFPETHLEDASKLAERLRQLVSGHDWHTLEPDLGVTLSLGLSEKNDAQSLQELLKMADLKLYEAKHAGRNRVR